MGTVSGTEGDTRVTAFLRALAALGWSDGHNLRIDIRWGAGEGDRIARYAAELVALAPEAILAGSGATMPALLRETRSIPIVFVLVPDPLGSGFVASLARPGGNATGFTLHEFATSGKWREVLKEIAPGVARVAVLWDPGDPAGAGQFDAIRAASPSVGTELQSVDVRDPATIERGLATAAARPDVGMIVTGSAPAGVHRQMIIALAARHRLPAVYPYPFFAHGGGLVAYGPDTTEPYRRAAGYVDRILKGEKPGDMPVQAPTRYELVVNMRTAKALRTAIPASLLARADDVVE